MVSIRCNPLHEECSRHHSPGCKDCRARIITLAILLLSLDILHEPSSSFFANGKRFRSTRETFWHPGMLLFVGSSGSCLPSGLGESPRVNLWTHRLRDRSRTCRLHGWP